jgi:hypothetical protein
MSNNDACRRCGSLDAWLVSPLREHDGIMPVEAWRDGGVLITLGWYEVAVCAGCGHTQFSARDYAPPRAPTTVRPCLECGSTRAWRIDEAPDLYNEAAAQPMRVRLAPSRHLLGRLFAQGGRQGTLAVDICADCGAAAWRCPAATCADERARGPASPRNCRRCGGAQVLAPIYDDSQGEGVFRRAIAVEEPFSIFVYREHGRFDADVCLGCSAVEWHGSELHALTHDPARGVTRIRRRTSGAGDDGPYR